ncbi:MAG: alpha-L-fucosidase [Phycisphaeraceae bacterium]|nr:alpha-L-fucosidase [Phycisphaeraceae bacterium]
MTSQAIPVPPPRIARFEKLGYGLFLHFGLYSLVGRGEWYMEHHQVPADEYNQLVGRFTASAFDPRDICRWAKRGGMRYIVLTARHHDGFSLYDTRGLNRFDAPNSPAGRDLIAEFVEACRAEDVVPFLYHTTLDWQWKSHRCDEAKFNEYLDYLQESVRVVCTAYGPLGGLWFDGNWSRRQSDWKEDRLYGMIRELQPEAMIINNSSIGALGATGHAELDVVTYEQGRPRPMDRRGMAKYLAAEMCQTMNHHWGLASRDFAYKSPRDLILDLLACRRVGANYLLNVGPTGEGAIPDYERAAIERAGEWVNLHAEALYEARPTALTVPGRDFVLAGPDERHFLVVHDLVIHKNDHEGRAAGGREGLRTIEGIRQPVKRIRWLDNDEELRFVQDVERGYLAVDCTPYPYGTDLVARIAVLE